MPSRRGKPPKDGLETRQRLVDAGRRLFSVDGFHGTDTNRIAREAQVAPATLYVHFVDKTDVFRAVYSAWVSEMWERLSLDAIAGGPPEVIARRMARSLVEHYRKARGIRATVQSAALRAPAFRELYLSEGRRQLELAMNRRSARGSLPRAREDVLATLLIVERLCDALANDEV
ncbi:MAG: TetR/AcrR family transcriptional regulator, partial [Myxococcaceae bacterium]|nr:TetR/AcrR family transcriptional regulator [Myxococcaceae bacterium]